MVSLTIDFLILLGKGRADPAENKHSWDLRSDEVMWDGFPEFEAIDNQQLLEEL